MAAAATAAPQPFHTRSRVRFRIGSVIAEEQRRLKNGAPAHELTDEERRRGGRAAQEKLRRERAEISEQALENLHKLIPAALAQIAVALRDGRGDHWAVREVLDRTLGKPTTPVELSGEVGVAGFDALLERLRLTIHSDALEQALKQGNLAAARRAFKEARSDGP